MCGICGIINLGGQPVKEEQIRNMMRAQKHRGPDDEGLFLDRHIGFGFVRLSILDLSVTGHQPMFDKSGRWMIIHNGEVYNYLEIREELKKKGYIFVSGTDTEVVLYAYIEWGANSLEKFNGMWASVIYDRETREIFISRDRFGIKPFYYYKDQDFFCFASEILPILKVLNSRPVANMRAVFDYLVFNRTDVDANTFFEGIQKLPHAHCMKITCLPENGGIHEFLIRSWYDLKQKVSGTKPYRQPVGVCLSGGLDSSSIAGILLDRFGLKDIHTFSAVFGKGETGDESEYIMEFRPKIKNMFFTSPTAEILLNDLNTFIEAHCEPVPSPSPYAQYKVMELASGSVVVTLDGQGADEQFAGYHYFFGFYFKELLRAFRIARLISELTSYSRRHRSMLGLKSFFYFLMPENLRTVARIAEKSYLKRDFSESYRRKNLVSENIYASKSLNQSLMDHFEFKLEHLLKWEDRNSMHFWLESRVPFLDHNLVERILALGPEEIIKKGVTKHFLREAVRDTIPEKIQNRNDKIGFQTPSDKWFSEPGLINLAMEIVFSPAFVDRGIVDYERARKMLSNHAAGKTDHSGEIWKWINLEMWFRKFIDDPDL